MCTCTTASEHFPPFAPLFIRLICCAAAAWTRRGEGQAPFCTARLQKPAAVCHRRDLKPQSVHLHTYTPMHLLYTQTNATVHADVHMTASRKTEWEREIKERKPFSPHIHYRDFYLPILWRGKQKASLSSMD